MNSTELYEFLTVQPQDEFLFVNTEGIYFTSDKLKQIKIQMTMHAFEKELYSSYFWLVYMTDQDTILGKVLKTLNLEEISDNFTVEFYNILNNEYVLLVWLLPSTEILNKPTTKEIPLRADVGQIWDD